MASNEQLIKLAIRDTASESVPTARGAWATLLDNFVLGESLESEEIDHALANGYLEAFVKELNREPIRYDILFKALGATTWICLSQKHALEVAEFPGFLTGLYAGAKKWIPDEIGRKCLACFKNLAMKEETTQACLAAGGLELALSNLKYLHEGNEYKNLAIGAAQLICRMVGRAETGPGAEAIRHEPQIIEALLWIFTRILDVGPQGLVLGITWYPVGTISDVASLCSSEKNRPLLGPFIPQIIRMLETRSEHPRALNRAVFSLIQLYLEPKCRVFFDSDRDRLLKVLERLQNRDNLEKQSAEYIQIMLNTLLCQQRKARAF